LHIAYKLPLGFKKFIFVILLVVVSVDIFQHHRGVRFDVSRYHCICSRCSHVTTQT